MKSLILSALRRHAQGRHSGSTILAKLANAYLSGYLNYDHDPTHNGEYNLLRRLRGSGLRVFFDVGANQGDWSNFVISNFPDADVHAFEIVPNTYKRLRRQVDSRVNANDFGMSDVNGKCQAMVYEENDRLSTTITNKGIEIHKLTMSRIEVNIARGDEYCKSQEISNIDFLKIDVEGADHKVMVGFGDIISKGQIKIIQFEYGMANIYTKFLLRDYYHMLGERYLIGRLCPRGVDFKEYDPQEENFRSPNFVSVERRQQALINRIKVA